MVPFAKKLALCENNQNSERKDFCERKDFLQKKRLFAKETIVCERNDFLRKKFCLKSTLNDV